MSIYGRRQRELDAVKREMRKASILQTLGWTLLVFDCIIASWVWTGFRAGTYFWLYWMIIEGAAGFVLVLVGSHLRSKAGRFVSRVMDEDEERKAA